MMKTSADGGAHTPTGTFNWEGYVLLCLRLACAAVPPSMHVLSTPIFTTMYFQRRAVRVCPYHQYPRFCM